MKTAPSISAPKPASLFSFETVLAAAIMLLLAAQLHLQFVQKINWDEFYFLSFIYDYQRGDLTKALQTFHVHGFGWLKFFSASEITQIEIARSVMWALQIGTMVCMYITARLFLTQRAALFAVLAYISAGFTLLHGTSFRADPIAAFFMMACAAIVARSNFSAKAAASFAICAALGGLVTIKVALYAPLFIGLGLIRLTPPDTRKYVAARLIIMTTSSLILFALGYVAHSASLQGASTSASGKMLSSAMNTTILSSSLFPQLTTILKFIGSAIPSALLMICGIYIAIKGLLLKERRDQNVSKAWFIVACATPLLCLVFYRNAYPYFFPYIIPSAAIAAGYCAQKISSRTFIAPAIAAALIISGLWQYQGRLSQTQTVQRETIDAMHQIFAQPISYIDRCSMIAGFPKRGMFMSTWGLQNYVKRGAPIYADLAMTQPIAAVINNTPYLDAALRKTDENRLLLPEDDAFISENFIPHWGHIWVAGKELVAAQNPQYFTIAVPGLYTVESAQDIMINDQSFTNGDTLTLERGAHVIQSEIKSPLTIRWGDNLARPEMTPSEGLIFDESF